MLQTLQIGLLRQAQVITSLAMREIRLRNSKFAFSYFMDVLEAIGFVAVMTAISLYVQRTILIGDSILVFIATGILPILYFRSISVKAAAGVRSSRGLGARALHNVTPVDAALARGFVESVTYILVMMLLFGGCALLRISNYAIPYALIDTIEALVMLTLFGLGFGMINSVILVFFPMWGMIWALFSRGQIFLCAIQKIPEYMPPYMLDLIKWNPVAHMVAMFRSSFYPTYPRHFVDKEYVLIWVGCVLLIGLAVQRVLRNRIALA